MDPDFPDKTMRCLRCKHEWKSPTGATTCVKCPGMYVEWLNHQGWQKAFSELDESEVTEELEP